MYYIGLNDELEGWEVMEKDAIHTEDYGAEDTVVATFYDYEKALDYEEYLNSK